MPFALGTFTGRFHHIEKSDLSPAGRILSIWQNAAGGTFYRDVVELSFLSTNLNAKGKIEEAKEIADIMAKMREAKAR